MQFIARRIHYRRLRCTRARRAASRASHAPPIEKEELIIGLPMPLANELLYRQGVMCSLTVCLVGQIAGRTNCGGGMGWKANFVFGWD